MTVTIRNESQYPDEEVSDLVRWAMRPFGVRNLLVVVTNTRRGPYSGRAWDGLVDALKPWPATADRCVQLRIGKPGEFPMPEPVTRHGWVGEGPAPGARTHNGWPVFQHPTWQEALVGIAAHEAKHIEDYMLNRRTSYRARKELACEVAAQGALDRFASYERKEYVMADTAIKEGKGAQILIELRAALDAIEGVEVIEKGSYATVKFGKTTLGYVTGKNKVRVDLPMRGGVRANMAIVTKGDVAKVVTEMKTFIPPMEQQAKPDPKPAAKPRKSRAKKDKPEPSAELEADLSKVADVINEELAK